MFVPTIGTIVAIIVLGFLSVILEAFHKSDSYGNTAGLIFRLLSGFCYLVALFLFPVVYTLGWVSVDPVIIGTLQVTTLFYLFIAVIDSDERRLAEKL